MAANLPSVVRTGAPESPAVEREPVLDARVIILLNKYSSTIIYSNFKINFDGSDHAFSDTGCPPSVDGKNSVLGAIAEVSSGSRSKQYGRGFRANQGKPIATARPCGQPKPSGPRSVDPIEFRPHRRDSGRTHHASARLPTWYEGVRAPRVLTVRRQSDKM